MFILMSLSPALSGGDSALLGIAIGIPIWAIGGACFGFMMWLVQGRNERAEPETEIAGEIVIPEGTYTISTRAHRNLFIVCAMGFVGFLILMIATNYFFGILIFGFFLVLSLFVLPFYWGSISVNRERIRHSCGYGTFQIEWCDVTHIEIDPGESALVFFGNQKRLPIPGSGSWTGPESREFEAVIRGEIETRGLEVRDSRFAGYKFPRNVRVTA